MKGKHQDGGKDNYFFKILNYAISQNQRILK